MLEECGGLERTDFYIYIITISMILWKSVVVLKKLILTVSKLEGVVVLKELIFNSFYVGRVWWS